MNLKSINALFLLLLVQSIFAFSNNIESEGLIFQLEERLEEKIRHSINLVTNNDNIHVSVLVKFSENSSMIEKNYEKNQFDYLPLIVKESVGGQKNKYPIESYLIKIMSSAPLIQQEIESINKVIQTNMVGRNHDVEYVVIKRATTFLHIHNALENFFKSSIFNGLLLSSFFIVSMFYLINLTRKNMSSVANNKSVLNQIHSSNHHDLIYFIRSALLKNVNILKDSVGQTQRDILGLKSLVPYLETHFNLDEIIHHSSLLRIGNEKNYYSEDEFSLWLKECSEKITSNSLKNYSAKEKEIEPTLLVRLRNTHLDFILRALEDINQKDAYSLVLEVIGQDNLFRSISPTHYPLFEGTNDSNLSIHEKEYLINNILNQIDKDKGAYSNDNLVKMNKHSQEKFEWTKDNLSLIPFDYIKSKLIGKLEEEIAEIISPLSDKERYFMMTHIDSESMDVNLIMNKLETLENHGTSELDQFIQEIQNDYNNNIFDIEAKKVG
jgi:hypothetical protein